jgi:hypothetical protein
MPDDNILAGCDMLHRNMTIIRRRFLVLLWFLGAFAPHAVLPDLRVIRPFIGADTVGFDLAGVQRCTAITCIAQGKVVGRR